MSARRLSIACLLVLCCAWPLQAQRASTAVVPQTITVGDVFHAAVQVQLPPGATVQAPDSLVLGEELELAGRMEIRYDSANGERRAIILYPLTAWRPGNHQLPPLRVRVITDGAASDMNVALPAFAVTSVLPQDTTDIAPRGAKDVLGANRLWWPILLALLLALIVGIALYIWWRRRRPKVEAVMVPAVPPRAAALAQLEALAKAGLIERGELRPYYIRLTEILRHYAQTVDGRWSVDLTTSELAQRMRAGGFTSEAVDLVRILGTGDMVKFARLAPDAHTARADLDAARGWVERNPRAAPETEERRAA
jgi:hypothetical protein